MQDDQSKLQIPPDYALVGGNILIAPPSPTVSPNQWLEVGEMAERLGCTHVCFWLTDRRTTDPIPVNSDDPSTISIRSIYRAYLETLGELHPGSTPA